ncbi:hypothetical protein [Sandarakinorhabdus oryzae]|uniref:hypothetical protein n=1 Tax=Sandarakinorhabdus oryzae TaxID=2675220 RepID=UPI0012E15050|nr:hypothetical protein [Sandarakinorhabdus oryzae]
MPDRRGLLTALALGLPLASAAAAAPPDTEIEEWTFLKAAAADPAALLRFLEANWLAMDRIAVAQGLFAHARLHRADPADGAAWDVVMVVGYRTPAGYDGVRAAFEAIRVAHRPVQPDDLPFASLGRITESRRVRLVASA